MYNTETRPIFPPLASKRPALFAWLKAAFSARKQRRQLADMTCEQLTDLGLTRDEALREAHKPLWDVPQHWLR